MKQIFALFTLFSLIVWGAAAQPTEGRRTLRDLLQEAVRENPRLAAARSFSDKASHRIRQASAWEPPRVSLTLMDAPASSVDILGRHMERLYTVEQMIPFPGKTGAAFRAASAAAIVEAADARRTELWLTAEMKRQYAHVQSARRRGAVNEQQRELLKQMIISTESKYGVGLASQADVLRLTIELRKLENEQSAIDQDERSATYQMNLLLGREPATPLPSLPDYDPQPPALSVDSLVALAVERHPVLVAASADVTMAEAELAMATREYWPDIMIGAGYRNRRLTPDSWEIMLGVSIPVMPWAFDRVDGRADEQRAGVAAANRMRDDARLMVRLDVRDMYQQMMTRWNQAERYRTKILPEAERALSSLQSAYQTNRSDFLSLIDSFRMLQMFRMEYVMEVMEYQMTRAELERAADISFDDFE